MTKQHKIIAVLILAIMAVIIVDLKHSINDLEEEMKSTELGQYLSDVTYLLDELTMAIDVYNDDHLDQYSKDFFLESMHDGFSKAIYGLDTVLRVSFIQVEKTLEGPFNEDKYQLYSALQVELKRALDATYYALDDPETIDFDTYLISFEKQFKYNDFIDRIQDIIEEYQISSES